MSKWLLAIICVSTMTLSGCSTIEGAARGVKKDADMAWNYMQKEDGWLKQTDNWMKENLW